MSDNKKLAHNIILKRDGEGGIWLQVPNGAICLNAMKGDIIRQAFVLWAEGEMDKVKPPSDEELVEIIINEVDYVKSLDGEESEHLRKELRKLLQSRQPDADTAAWIDKVHELEIENAKLREKVRITREEIERFFCGEKKSAAILEDWLKSKDIEVVEE